RRKKREPGRLGLASTLARIAAAPPHSADLRPQPRRALCSPAQTQQTGWKSRGSECFKSKRYCSPCGIGRKGKLGDRKSVGRSGHELMREARLGRRLAPGQSNVI